ncbi:hypothetical protein FWH58_02815 [Candidatus Saccharibacteria bacterium]|nr:hypothetical protein [Candidatus Saccharibacteria bacterium]
MIKSRKPGEDIFSTKEKDIAFAVNTEGINDSGFAGTVAMKLWPELANIGPSELGTIMSKTADDGRTYHALVCHSLKNGWVDQAETIKKCFDQIPNDEEKRAVASVAIGTGFVGILSGANFEKILEGMEQSETPIVLFG